jgi:putative spermidine/putrescine transport system ATP-binding protein
MRSEIRRIHNMLGSSTIYVTHDQDEALSMADRIVVMRAGLVRQVGTPQELYARPAHADVAEFMGFRNLLPTKASRGTDGFYDVSLGGAQIKGVALEELVRPDAMLAIRPEDLVPQAGGPIAAIVEAAEYRGRSFFGSARTSDGIELHFRSDQPVLPSSAIRLGAEPQRVLVYAGGLQ